MKTFYMRACALGLAALLSFGAAIPASAAVVPGSEAEIQASKYFTRTSATVAAAGSGVVDIQVIVKATGTMTELGATTIHVYEKQSDGSDKKVYTYTRSTKPVLIVKNAFSANINVSYQGKAGKSYYATATCYAKNAAGSETVGETSNVVKAT